MDDTEIPLLQQHAMRLPEKMLIHAHKSFLHEFCGLLSSFSHWAGKGMSEAGVQKMSAQDEAYEQANLRVAARNFKRDLEGLIWAQKSDLDDIINIELQSKSVTAITYASKRLDRIVKRWHAKPDTGGWGIAYPTYKAICRRNGAKTKFKTARDFNEDILEPYLKKVASGWEQVFGHSVPQSLDKFATIFCQQLAEFHTMMSSRPELRRCKEEPLRSLLRQIKFYEAIMTDKVANLKSSIQNEQRQASRAFHPEIKNQMLKAYTLASNEQGECSFLRPA